MIVPARIASLALAATMAFACGGGGGGGGGDGAAGPRLALDPLGVTIALPAGSQVDTEDASDVWVDVMVPGWGELKVARADELDIAAEKAHQASYGVTDFEVEEFPGGVSISYSYRDVGTTYHTRQVIMTVAGRRFSCGFSGGGRRELRDAEWLVAPCKTLRAK